MLTADLVNARRRGHELRLIPLDDFARERAKEIAGELIAAISCRVGCAREEILLALSSVDASPKERRLKDGLVKLVEDRCVFDTVGGAEPADVRRAVFTLASASRAALTATARFDRGAVIAAAADASGVSTDVIERALFADLRGAHRLLSFDAPSPRALVAVYESSQAQAVLLRATRVTLDVRCASAYGLRSLFRRLKFLRLLHTATRRDDGHRFVIDGPFSLFDSVTKYGLQLALMLPALEGCREWRLEADVRWGKERTPLMFRLEGPSSAPSPERAPQRSSLPEEVDVLVRAFEALGTGWRAKVNTEILELPGVGLSVPDLVFERRGATGDGARQERVYLEVMGYWSRAAVWKRIELVQAGLTQRILFAVSAKLRVSEDALPSELPGALYVYKQRMSARAIAERLDRLSSTAPRVPCTPGP